MHREVFLRKALIYGALMTGIAACGSDTAKPATASKPGEAGAHAGDAATHDAATHDAAFFDTSGGPTDPIPTKPFDWVWVPFPDAKCRDGSTAGIQVNANPASDQLMIFLEGGGSCWNPFECFYNPPNFVPPATFIHPNGVFDRTKAENPVKDWNMVYVPYCTGDLHAGNNPGADPGGVGPQQFVGYTNIEKFLDRVVPTFPNLKKLLYTGFSAGGAGALLTVEIAARKFPSSVEIVLVDDSSPPVALSFLAPCIQRMKWTTFGFDKTFLADCGADCPDPNNYYMDYPLHLAKKYPRRRSGIIEADADATIVAKLGYTANDCNTDIRVGPAPMDPAVFKAALLDFRARIDGLVPDGGTRAFGTYFPPGDQHGWLVIGDSLYTTTVGGEKLIDWFSGMVNGTSPTNVGL